MLTAKLQAIKLLSAWMMPESMLIGRHAVTSYLFTSYSHSVSKYPPPNFWSVEMHHSAPYNKLTVSIHNLARVVIAVSFQIAHPILPLAESCSFNRGQDKNRDSAGDSKYQY
jgi:hypothetical protein